MLENTPAAGCSTAHFGKITCIYPAAFLAKECIFGSVNSTVLMTVVTWVNMAGPWV